ncbi:alanine:cation symporter family protein [Thermaerobacter subterraneus]|uniref:alanine:cation symporter family protein n=1 Tax=Thermaerobacter subterraneus TaxID=175696 RepID=UPI0001EB685F|nr:alanine:cation symporter family protein [Thermaerobacter subterraneus]
MASMKVPAMDTSACRAGWLIVPSAPWQQADAETLTGAPLTTAAFEAALGRPGAIIVVVGRILFAYSTILGWVPPPGALRATGVI